MKAEITPAIRETLEELAVRFHAQHVGHLIRAAYLCGYDKHDDSVDYACNPPVVVRVLPMRPHEGILHWNDEWLDPYWDVEVVSGEGRALTLRSTWIDGPSINAETGEWEWKNVEVLPLPWYRRLLQPWAKGGSR